MSKKRLLLCCDMDRTVIPNGDQPESGGSRELLTDFCSRPEVTFAYVTGRDRAMVKEAIASYALPAPDFAMTDVGTVLYRVQDGEWLESPEWMQHISVDWPGCVHEDVAHWLSDLPGLRLQEQEKQNNFKVSFYAENASPVLRLDVEGRLQRHGLKANVVVSIDESSGTGFVDVLSARANKYHAVRFVQQMLGYDDQEVIFAGDSGNDLEVLVSPIPAILVGNATEAIRQEATQKSEAAQTRDRLYLAKANYAGGVLEGLQHFYDHV